MDVGKKMRLTEPEQFHAMVKMHLSFLLDLHTDECDCTFMMTEKPEKETVDSKLKKAFTPMKKAKAKGVMDGVPLTQEGVCQVYQIIEFLGRPHNITTEGIFRKHGNLKKQQALKERLNRGIALDLDDGEFSVHECASVLKQFLANLPQPILTEAYFRAHCQVPLLVKESMTDEEREVAVDKQVACVQLLFQLIPPVHLALLKDLLLFLQAVAAKESENKMNSANLATMFSTHLLCPRKLSPETLQAQHQLLANVVAFMIEHAHKLFVLPNKLLLDIETYISKKEGLIQPTPKVEKEQNGLGSPVVSTVFSFVDRSATQAATTGNETDKALAQLYAHVQSMPASAHKRRLVRQLNDANGRGTPEVATSGSFSTVGKSRQRRKSGDGLINLLTPRRKRPPVTGSYSVQGAVGRPPRREVMSSSSFRRQNSHPTTPLAPPRASLLSPSHLSSPAVLSPCRERLPSPTLPTTPNSQSSEVCDIDEVDTPGKEETSDTSEAGEEEEDGPPLPPRTPAPLVIMANPTPTSLSPGVRRAMATPRSRGGLMVSSGQLEKWNRLLDSAKPEQLIFEDAEGEENGAEGVDLDEEEEEEFEEEISPRSELEEGEDEESESESEEASSSSGNNCSAEDYGRDKTSAYRSQTLSKEFEAYLAKHGLEPEDGVKFVDSSFEEGNNSNITEEQQGNVLDASYSEEVRRLLRGESSDLMSTSMKVILDGGSPGSAVTSTSSLPSLSGRSCGSTTTLTALSQDLLAGKVDKTVDSSNNENLNPNSIVDLKAVGGDEKGGEEEEARGSAPRRGVKRRSLTETGEMARPLQAAQQQQATSIFFETDL